MDERLTELTRRADTPADRARLATLRARVGASSRMELEDAVTAGRVPRLEWSGLARKAISRCFGLSDVPRDLRLAVPWLQRLGDDVALRVVAGCATTLPPRLRDEVCTYAADGASAPWVDWAGRLCPRDGEPSGPDGRSLIGPRPLFELGARHVPSTGLGLRLFVAMQMLLEYHLDRECAARARALLRRGLGGVLGWTVGATSSSVVEGLLVVLSPARQAGLLEVLIDEADPWCELDGGHGVLMDVRRALEHLVRPTREGTVAALARAAGLERLHGGHVHCVCSAHAGLTAAHAMLTAAAEVDQRLSRARAIERALLCAARDHVGANNLLTLEVAAALGMRPDDLGR